MLTTCGSPKEIIYTVKGVVLFGVSLSVLISGANEKSVRMPHGMTREERRQWVSKFDFHLARIED